MKTVIAGVTRHRPKRTTKEDKCYRNSTKKAAQRRRNEDDKTLTGSRKKGRPWQWYNIRAGHLQGAGELTHPHRGRHNDINHIGHLHVPEGPQTQHVVRRLLVAVRRPMDGRKPPTSRWSRALPRRVTAASWSRGGGGWSRPGAYSHMGDRRRTRREPAIKWIDM